MRQRPHYRRSRKGRVFRAGRNYSFSPATRTPSEDLTAVERFGKGNIKQLKYLGQGRDRIVYDIGDDKVLKIAKNVKGLDQNEADMGLNDYTLPRDKVLDVHEAGRDYVVAEKAVRDDKEINKFLKPLKRFSQKDFDDKTGELQDAMEGLGLSDFMNYNLAFNDFNKARNWGMIKGRPSLIDGGALMKSSADMNTITKEEKREWEEIKRRRRWQNQ